MRVRGFTQDDAHIFCTPEQVEDEFQSMLDLTAFVLASVGVTDYRVQLSLRDPQSTKYVGSDENWAKAEAAVHAWFVDNARARALPPPPHRGASTARAAANRSTLRSSGLTARN